MTRIFWVPGAVPLLNNGTPSRAADFVENQRFAAFSDTVVFHALTRLFQKVSNAVPMFSGFRFQWSEVRAGLRPQYLPVALMQ
ncbi:hypothetical protein AT5A_08950 [Agrobacterium tumefaciens 5A]|nr:hypothetical protein AT5A_08950 [Agrobacterium tumefaciens 5A]